MLTERIRQWARWGSCVLEVACEREQHRVRYRGSGRLDFLDHIYEPDLEAVVSALGAPPASRCAATAAEWDALARSSLPNTRVMFEVRRRTNGSLLRVRCDWRVFGISVKHVMTVLQPS